MDRLPLSRWRLVAGLLASSLLLGLYARGGAAWVLGALMLVPWLLALNATRTVAGTLANALVMSVALVAAIFYWFGAAIGGFTGIGAVSGTAVLLVLAPVMQPQVLAFALVRHVVGRHHGALLRALAGASAWVACEWALPKLLGDTLGHGLFPSTLLRQAADLGGAAGLTFLLILVNEGIAEAITRRRLGTRALLPPLAGAVTIIVAMAAYGAARLPALRAPPPTNVAMLRVAMVQASITNYEKLRQQIGAYGVVRKVLDTNFALSKSAVRDHGADVLLWSETVYPTTFGNARSEDGAALDREILAFVDVLGVPLVFGTYDVDVDGEYNAAAFVEPRSGLLGFYRKTYPFPLTEHVPRWLDGPRLRQWLPWTGGWQAGYGSRVMPLRSADGREVNVLPMICLDDVNSGLAIDGARLGAQAIIGLSNDSWFNASPAGARLHLSVAAFRSIETRLPQLRVTTNGPSAIIDATGEVLAHTDIGSQAVLTGELAAIDPVPTLIVRWGNWVGPAAAVFLGVLALVTAWRAAKGRRVVASASTFASEARVLPRPWRIAATTLRVFAGLALAWIALDMLRRRGWQVQSLSQLKLFAVAVVLPWVVAWGIERAFSSKRPVEGAGPGRHVLWLDNAMVKFVLFPLLPAAIAFRLHQMIAFGSPLGEYYTYGLGAWLTAAAIWWASWSLGLVLFAAALRIVVEVLSAIARWLAPARAADLHDAMSWISRALYYLGVPLWLGLRLLSD